MKRPTIFLLLCLISTQLAFAEDSITEGGDYSTQISSAPTSYWSPEHCCYICCQYCPYYYYKCECDYVPQQTYQRCCRTVPQFYTQYYCRYVPKYYSKTLCRQVPEYYYDSYVTYIPRNRYKLEVAYYPNYYYSDCPCDGDVSRYPVENVYTDCQVAPEGNYCPDFTDQSFSNDSQYLPSNYSPDIARENYCPDLPLREQSLPSNYIPTYPSENYSPDLPVRDEPFIPRNPMNYNPTQPNEGYSPPDFPLKDYPYTPQNYRPDLPIMGH